MHIYVYCIHKYIYISISNACTTSKGRRSQQRYFCHSFLLHILQALEKNLILCLLTYFCTPIESSTMEQSSTTTETSTMAESSILPSLNVVNLTCNLGFFEQNFTCLPRCDTWDERPHAYSTIDDVVRIGSIIPRWIVCVIFLVAFVKRRKAM